MEQGISTTWNSEFSEMCVLLCCQFARWRQRTLVFRVLLEQTTVPRPLESGHERCGDLFAVKPPPVHSSKELMAFDILSTPQQASNASSGICNEQAAHDILGDAVERRWEWNPASKHPAVHFSCLLYTSDAADEEDSVDLGGRRIIKKKKRVVSIRLRIMKT
eukprot:TRINITY_DN4089_c0_g1_i5.p1 TRINITY_DN4089_c0_g1~~TRINITY_DN4089_c0_g1_i5.p1  ORF type:complete len:162 (-),score=2.70 TRINITY_DN4089_c0_g1_i5:46-531(-)